MAVQLQGCGALGNLCRNDDSCKRKIGARGVRAALAAISGFESPPLAEEAVTTLANLVGVGGDLTVAFVQASGLEIVAAASQQPSCTLRFEEQLARLVGRIQAAGKDMGVQVHVPAVLEKFVPPPKQSAAAAEAAVRASSPERYSRGAQQPTSKKVVAASTKPARSPPAAAQGW
mmetsp:Transcript_18196/g.39082  ORF Transcript_18196/g.39082 Transcript_18196/m.39082 type:complete len:174 (+) Transcript_18196:1-522(+)